MMIVDAINTAPTEYAVFFLVTAYLESLHHLDRGFGIPKTLISLPLAGKADLNERLSALRNNINVPLEAVVTVSEASAVLNCAVQRLSDVASPS